MCEDDVKNVCMICMMCDVSLWIQYITLFHVYVRTSCVIHMENIYLISTSFQMYENEIRPPLFYIQTHLNG